MTEKIIQKDPEALREAKFADLLLIPFSEEAKNFEQDLTHMTVSFLLKNGYWERRLKSDALIRFKATISALIGDLLVAALNEASKGFCYRSSKKTEYSVTIAQLCPDKGVVAEWLCHDRSRRRRV